MSEEIELESEVGVDYSQLKELLSQRKWKEADLETARVMLKAAKREKEGWLDVDSLKKFPCADLQTIDQLWVKYSGGRFGFSVQKKIYRECGGKLDGEYPGDEIWYDFCKQVGWRRINGEFAGGYELELYFDTAPSGHLPLGDRVGNFFLGLSRIKLEIIGVGILSRAETCNL